MKIGVTKEIKKHEYRVGMTPQCVKAYSIHGHEILIEKEAGIGSGYEDDEYERSGAVIVDDKEKIFNQCQMIVKVKEPVQEEYRFLHEDQVIYTYFHLAANKELALKLLEKKVTAVAYETIELSDGSLPCLTPMSEIAGRGKVSGKSIRWTRDPSWRRTWCEA